VLEKEISMFMFYVHIFSFRMSVKVTEDEFGVMSDGKRISRSQYFRPKLTSFARIVQLFTEGLLLVFLLFFFFGVWSNFNKLKTPGAKFTKHLTTILRQKSYDHFLGVLQHSKLYDSNIIQQEKLLCIYL